MVPTDFRIILIFLDCLGIGDWSSNEFLRTGYLVGYLFGSGFRILICVQGFVGWETFVVRRMVSLTVDALRRGFWWFSALISGVCICTFNAAEIMIAIFLRVTVPLAPFVSSCVLRSKSRRDLNLGTEQAKAEIPPVLKQQGQVFLHCVSRIVHGPSLNAYGFHVPRNVRYAYLLLHIY